MMEKMSVLDSQNINQSRHYRVTLLATLYFLLFFISRSLLKFGIERTPSPKKGHLLAESEESDDGILETSKL